MCVGGKEGSPLPTKFSITEATVDATIAAMGWSDKRIPGTSRIRLDQPDGCGYCGRPCREYDVKLGIPICSRTCEELAR